MDGGSVPLIGIAPNLKSPQCDKPCAQRSTRLIATPTQLVFGRDALLNVSFEADWQYLKDQKQKRILHNNKRENKTRLDHTYSVGDKVMIRLNPNRKHGTDTYKGPYDVTGVNDNGTVTLTQVTNGGAVSQTWNIRQLEPCMD